MTPCPQSWVKFFSNAIKFEKELEISKCGIKYGQCEYKSFLYSTYIFFSWENTFENTCDCLIFDSRPKYLCTFPQPPINMLHMIIPFAQAGGCIIWYVGHTVVYWWYRAAYVTFRIYHFFCKRKVSSFSLNLSNQNVFSFQS